jgi:hypothetical protein
MAAYYFGVFGGCIFYILSLCDHLLYNHFPIWRSWLGGDGGTLRWKVKILVPYRRSLKIIKVNLIDRQTFYIGGFCVTYLYLYAIRLYEWSMPNEWTVIPVLSRSIQQANRDITLISVAMSNIFVTI